MLKNLILAMILIAALTLGTFAWAAYNRTLLVLDMRNSPELPKHFRTTSDAIANPGNLDLTGFSSLHAAGSAQFSKLSFENALQKIKAKSIVIVDLREESHGFLNGNAVSWFGPHNATNAGLKPIMVEHNQAKLLSELDKLNLAKVFKILKKTPDAKIDKVQPIDFSVYQVASEADVMATNHLDYERIYVQDYHPPGDNQVDRFIRLVRSLPTNGWIYFHCRAGMGRTSTFMAMYDMMRNAKHVAFEQILARQFAIGGKDFGKLPAPGSYKYKFAVERLNFLKKFYEYTHTNDDNYRTSWKEWLRNHRNNL